MKVNGIVRNLDELGRVVVPKEMRDILNYGLRAKVDISLEGDTVIIKKVEETDIFNGELTEDLVEFRGKKISKKTIKELLELIDEN